MNSNPSLPMQSISVTLTLTPLEQRELLLLAIQHSDERVSELLKLGIHPDVRLHLTDEEYKKASAERQKACYPILPSMISSGSLTLINLMLSHGADPTLVDIGGTNSVMRLMNHDGVWSTKQNAQGMMKKLRLMVKKGLSLETPLVRSYTRETSDSDSHRARFNYWTPPYKSILATAIYQARLLKKEEYGLAIVHELLQLGANVNEALSEQSPLVLAIRNQHKLITTALLAAGADPNSNRPTKSLLSNSIWQEARNAGSDFVNLLQAAAERQALLKVTQPQQSLPATPSALACSKPPLTHSPSNAVPEQQIESLATSGLIKEEQDGKRLKKSRDSSMIVKEDDSTGSKPSHTVRL